ncbi:MAG: hypothetical protein ACXVK3_12125 [Candidatus Angelobacter sp.]
MNSYWLRAVRLSAFCIFLVIFVPMALMYGSLLTHYDPVDSSGERLQWGFLPFLLWLPYFQVFWRLRDISDSEKVKKALAQSVAWGFFGALLASSGALSSWSQKDWTTAFIVSTLAIFLVLLLGSAIKGYYSMERRPGDVLILAARFAVIPLIVVPLAIIIPDSSFISMEYHETAAADALRTINKAQAEYAKTHPGKGSAASLEDLGPPPGAGLIDGDLANGRRYNYTITLSPAPSNTSGHAPKYTLTAGPQSYGSFGRRRFVTDESGVIRYTAEDRAPTPQDRVLPWF